MAKSKVKDEKAPAGVVPRRDKESEAEAQLRAYHALGRKVLARIKDGPLDAATLRELHEETGHGFDNLRKARVFARVYTQEQLDALCKLRTPKQDRRINLTRLSLGSTPGNRDAGVTA